jgi:hypothetical protein
MRKEKAMKISPFNVPVGAKFLLVFSMAVCFTAVASATSIDFEDLSGYDINDNLALVDPGYAGLDWTKPNTEDHWRIKKPAPSGYPFSGSGGSDNWLLGSADTDAIDGSGNFAKITWNLVTPFHFNSMDLKTKAGSGSDKWLTQLDIRARDIDDDVAWTRIALTTSWTPYTATGLSWTTTQGGTTAIDFTSLDGLKSLTFFGDSVTTGGDFDRFALDNLAVDVAGHTPEPTTLVLMGIGLLGVLGVVIRQRRKEK